MCPLEGKTRELPSETTNGLRKLAPIGADRHQCRSRQAKIRPTPRFLEVSSCLERNGHNEHSIERAAPLRC